MRLSRTAAQGFPAADIRVVEINAEARRKLVDKYGVTTFDKPKDAVRANDVVVFAVKPQHLREAASKSGIADNANLAISIAAGVRLANLSKWLKDTRAWCARCPIRRR